MAPVVLTVKVATPLAVLELRFTVGFPWQVGKLVAPVGDDVNVHESATVPV